MNTKQVLSVFMVAILAASTATMVGIQSFQVANAQSGVTIETSADDLGRTFFGVGVLQVIITDTSESDDEDDATTEIEVTVEAEGVSEDLTIPDTSDGSQRFEFFIVHENGACADADPFGGCIADPESDDDLVDDQVLLFGDGAELDIEIDPDTDDDSTSFDISYRNTEVTIDYEEVSGSLTLDRETYGSDSIMYVVIKDQDANLDPTTEDDYPIDVVDIDDLFDVDGGVFVGDVDGIVTFEETGDNTAEFEATLQLTAAGDDDDDDTEDFDWDEDSLVMTLIDQDDYEALDDESTDTDTVSFDIDDVDGVFDDLEDPTFGSELILTLRDADRNIDSDNDDTIEDAVVVEVDREDGDSVTVDMEETGDNTGVFVPDTTNNEIKVTFVTAEEDIDPDDDILQLVREGDTNDITEDIVVTYTDPFDDDSVEGTEFEFELSMAITDGRVDLPDTSGINDDFTVTLTDPDLNDNPRSKDSYTLTLEGEGPHPLLRAGEDIGNVATFEFEFEGDVIDFGEVTETFVETGVNTGIFTATFDMENIIEEGELDVDDGDSLEVTYNDFMDDTTRESADELSVGRPDTDISLSRTVVPIPPEPDTRVENEIGDTVVLVISVIDPDQNVDSNSEESIFVDFDEVEGDPFFDITVDNCGDGDLDENIDSNDAFDGSLMEDLMAELLGLELAETGRSTGVFEEDLEFVFPDAADESNDLQDCEIEFTYHDADGDEESVGLTMRGNDAALSIDRSSAKTGDTVTVTVQDEDLNLDDDTIEEFDFSTTDDEDLEDDGPGVLLLIETEDDEIANLPTTETLRETGPDTGIFTVSLVVGEDIPVTDEDDPDEQASNILFTYEDEVDSTGSGGEEIEVNLPVVTATGSILVSPDLVGPGTTITVLITDADLNTDASGTDDYPGDNEGDGIVSFRTDRDAVGEASPDLDETGANTGVFEFEIELTPIEGGDDGEDDAPEAEGESEPSISVLPGDILSIRYEDDRDNSGRSTVVSKVIQIQSWDPEFAADNDSYGVDDRAVITISDPDANQDPDVADSLTDVRVFSDSDAVGEEISALETGVDTGVFRLSFQLTSTSSSGGINVNAGDTVTVEYNDEFPADYAERVEDVNDPDKEFTFTFSVGMGDQGTGATTPTAPSLLDVSGDPVDSVTVGQQVVLSTTIQNNNNAEQPFVALIEVRDSEGITVFLAWQTGTLNPSGSADVGLSWTPDAAGDYTVRTFIISDLANPNVLSEVAETEITVS